VGQGSVELLDYRLHSGPGFANFETLADAQDDVEPAFERGMSLGLNLRIALALGVTALAVADDGEDGPGIEQHVRGDAAGMGAFVGAVHILPADCETRNGARRSLDQDRGHAQGHINLRILARRVGDRPHLGEVDGHTMHLPITGNELLQRHSLPP
jgi:hypothetical protein